MIRSVFKTITAVRHEDMDSLLNSHSTEGWELISFHTPNTGDSFLYVALLRRDDIRNTSGDEARITTLRRMHV